MTQAEGGRREEKTQKTSTMNFGVLNALCELSIYRESSQLISEKLWEQVILILDLVQKYLKLSIKIYHIEYKIYYSIHKYIIEYQNIFHIMH